MSFSDAVEVLGGVDAAARLVRDERIRQICAEHWTPEHDDQHTDGQLADAAGAYAVAATNDLKPDGTLDEHYGTDSGRLLWPWQREGFKPRSHRHNLVRAGALILAELERIERLRVNVQYFRVSIREQAFPLHRHDAWAATTYDELKAFLPPDAQIGQIQGSYFASEWLGVPINYGHTVEDFFLSFAECGDVVLTQGPVNLSALVRERYRRWGVWPEAQAGAEAR